MSNIEEDVKTIKYRVDKCREEFEDFGEISFAYSDLDRIENILSEREQDKKRIKELEQKNEHLKYLYDDCCKCLLDTIEKQKVKDKIEDLRHNSKLGFEETLEETFKIEVLEELLEEK